MAFKELETNDIIDDRYKIISFLGEGGMAKVYKAHDIISDKDVAIKMMRQDTASVPANLARFEREARAAASLNHQNIVKVINVGTYEGLPFMVNELIKGQTLREILDVRGKFSFLEATDIMYQLCSAVMYAHQHGVIHRDIKPQNIFLTQDGTIKLADFGIATFQNSSHVTRSDLLVGSIHYLAPELSQSNPATERSDIYAMGITFFELITGTVPFDGPDTITIALMHVKDKFPNIKKYNPHTPECIENIIYKCCQKDPLDRYSDVSYLRKDIEKILKNPDLLKKKANFFENLFHPHSPVNENRREEREHRRALRRAEKKSRKENKKNV